MGPRINWPSTIRPHEYYYNLVNDSLFSFAINKFENDSQEYSTTAFDLGDDYENNALFVIRRVDENKLVRIHLPFDIGLRLADYNTLTIQLVHNANNNVPPTGFLVLKRFGNVSRLLLNTEHIQIISTTGSIGAINNNNFVHIKVSFMGHDVVVLQVREIGQQSRQVLSKYIVSFACTFDLLPIVNCIYTQNLTTDDPLTIYEWNYLVL